MRLLGDIYVDVDEEMRSSNPLIWAAGDCTSSLQAVIMAAADGARAAYSMNSALTLPDC